MPASRILLVEDNPGDVFLFQKALRRLSSPVTLEVAADGVEALEQLSRPGAVLPDLVLLDLNLPRLPGTEVLRRIRENPALSAVQVFILSSSRAEADLQSIRSLGADAYLLKPVDLLELRELVRALVEDWPARAALPSLL